MRNIVLVVHNVRSAHNVGSLLRTADGLGIEQVYLTGYTPFPVMKNDPRLPHLVQKADRQIHKTALGAENLINWQHEPDIAKLVKDLVARGYSVAALEQTKKSINLSDFKPADRQVLIVGNEVGGLDKSVLEHCDQHVQIPMSGRKESFNVSIAAAIALYHLSRIT